MFSTLFSASFNITRLNALLLALALVAISAVVGGAAGFALGYRSAQAEGEAALAQVQRDYAQADARAADAARLKLIAEVERGNTLARALADAKTSHALEKQSLLRRISDVTSVYIPAAGDPPLPLPRTVFTAGFLREYNTAIGLPLAYPGAPASGTGSPADAPAGLDAWLLDSGLSQADILAHIADYGERCRNLESQVNRLIDYKEAVDGYR
ncbi:MAG: hypothetical protein ACRDD3_08650 [Azovibrio sp.]